MNSFNDRLKKFSDVADRVVPNFRRGIEKESLRITPAGHLSRKPHPIELGSALTHPFITTDYSEALLELVTPTFETVEQTLDHLKILHQIVYHHIGNEVLWVNSLPCLIDDDHSIPIADFGTSNIGTMKRVYRKGLSLRYGRKMQVIAGIHYNFSVPDLFWKSLDIGATDNNSEAVSNAYMAGIRNFHRYCWLLFYLFGASPAACSSFFTDQTDTENLANIDTHTIYAPFATSLRMSNLGYRNPVQSEIRIDNNSIEQYINTLSATINTPYRPYQDFGIKKKGEYIQLNSNLLQIENEYYSVVRPKRRTLPMEKPTNALRREGVEYIEIRCLDLDPFEPLGISLSQAKFIETFITFCLLQPSPPFTQIYPRIISENKDVSVLRGRDPDAQLLRNGAVTSIADWGNDLMRDIVKVAETIDNATGGHDYSKSVIEQWQKLEDPDITSSARIVEHLRQSKEPFFIFALRQAQKLKEQITEVAPESSIINQYDEIASESVIKQRQIEKSDTEEFDQFLKRYFDS